MCDCGTWLNSKRGWAPRPMRGAAGRSHGQKRDECRCTIQIQALPWSSCDSNWLIPPAFPRRGSAYGAAWAQAMRRIKCRVTSGGFATTRRATALRSAFVLSSWGEEHKRAVGMRADWQRPDRRQAWSRGPPSATLARTFTRPRSPYERFDSAQRCCVIPGKPATGPRRHRACCFLSLLHDIGDQAVPVLQPRLARHSMFGSGRGAPAARAAASAGTADRQSVPPAARGTTQHPRDELGAARFAAPS